METPDEVTLKYKSIVKSNGIEDEVSEVIVKDAGLQGAGMAGQQLYVTVKFVDSKIKPLNLFVKAHTTNPSHSEMIDEIYAFEKESRFLTEYLPAAKEFCKSKGHEGILDFYPKCYYGDEKMVVFENLVLDKGYSLLNTDEKQDMDAVRFALTHLAKHHAVSYAFIKENGGPDPFFTRFPLFDFEPFSSPVCRSTFAPMIENSIQANIQILERHEVHGKESAIKLLKSALGRSYDMILEPTKMYKAEEKKLFVLNHGDYWNNNMMFRKDPKTNKITNHIAIDFQMGSFGSLGLDVGYYLFTTINPNVRRAHLKEILEMYLTTFKETIEKLGHPVDLTYEELFLMVRKKLNYGFWIGVGLCSEAGFTALRNINMNEIGEMKNFHIEFTKQITKWIDANPKKVKAIAEELVKLMDEYNELLIH